MSTARWVMHIEMAVPFLLAVGGGVGWLLLRKRPAAVVRRWRTGFVVAGVMLVQILIAHNIYMKGFDHGSAGQPRDEAYLSFFHGASYIGEDLHVHKNPFLPLLFLFAANGAFLWLLGRERCEAAQRLAAATGGESRASPSSSATP